MARSKAQIRRRKRIKETIFKAGEPNTLADRQVRHVLNFGSANVSQPLQAKAAAKRQPPLLPPCSSISALIALWPGPSS